MATDFFDRQTRARRNTKLLVVYFMAGVAMLVLSVYLAVYLVFMGLSAKTHRHRLYLENEPGAPPAASLWHPQLFLGVAVGTLGVIGLGSLFKTAELAQGGKAVASMLGGRLVPPNATDPDERRLLNVVEEMALASGVPVPQVYILPAEQGINAFAAGHSTSDAVIGVTRGTVKLLSRDELQGVIAHEFSHILNGDMRLNLRLMGILFGILCLAVIGRLLLQVRGGNSRDKNPLPILGLALIVIGWIGVFFGRLIQAAVSRQREFLADASAVQFTRNPAGLAGALKKIGGLSYGSRLQTAHAEEASHLFFSNGMRASAFHLLETHPPLKARILALDPGFDGTFPRVSLVQPDKPATSAAAAPRQPIPFPFPLPGTQPVVSGLAGLTGSLPPPVISAPTVIPSVGSPTVKHLAYATELRNSFSDSIQVSARESFGACTLIYALLLSSDATTQAKQLEELGKAVSQGVCRATLRILPDVRQVAARARLPLVDLALPALRDLSPMQFEEFTTAVQTLVDCDGEIDLFEYVLQKVVLRHLQPHFQPARKPVVQYYSIRPLAGDCAVLLSALAYVGQDDPARVQTAFAQGAAPLTYAAQVQLNLLPAAACGLDQVDQALDRLSQAVPQIKKNVLNACAQTVAADGLIQETEAELLRAIADALDCPLPPFIPESAPA